MSNRVDPMSALRFAWAPLKGVPTVQADASVSTSSALLFADATLTDGKGARRIRIYNTDPSASVGLFFIAAGGTATGLLIASSMKVGPGMVFDGIISNAVRVSAVASSGTVTVNCLVSDIE